MPNRLWVDKNFEFACSVGDFERLLEELARHPDRLAGLVQDVDRAELVGRERQSWSIQENVGHLSDVEVLFLGRLDDFDAGLAELRPADMTNMATEQAKYNDQDIAGLLARFGALRSEYLERLWSKPEGYFGKAAWHPRLQKQMRVVDQLEFQLAHDAHHIVRIEELL